MTLIVGIKCSDGVVVASDGAATFGQLGQPTIRQTTRKLDIVERRAIIGVSGPVGLGQLLKAEVQAFCGPGNAAQKQTVTAAMSSLQSAFWKHIKPAIEHATVSHTLIGRAALDDALSSTVVAVGLKDGPELIQFSAQAAPEHATKDLPFVAIGSGEAIADPFLAFLRRIFWPTDLPTLEEGIFCAVWTLDHAIRTNPGGIAEPMQVMVLTRNENERDKTAIAWRPKELLQEELEEHRQSVQAHETALFDYHRLDLDAENIESPPSPPAA